MTLAVETATAARSPDARAAAAGSTTGARGPGRSGRRRARRSPAATSSSRSSPSTSASRSGACGRCSCCSSGPAYGIDPAGKFLLTTAADRARRGRAAALHLRRRQVRRPQLDDRSAPRCCSSRRIAGRDRPRARRLLHARCWSSPALAGVGGGNFASSMANINAFYPERLKGWALGLNAGGGNLGVAAVQLVGLLVLATAGADAPAAASLRLHPADRARRRAGAALLMDNLTPPRNDQRAMRDVGPRPAHLDHVASSTSARSARSSASASRSARCCRCSSRPTSPTPLDGGLPDLPRPAARLADPPGRRRAGRPVRRRAGHLLELRRRWRCGAARRARRVAAASRCRCSSSASSLLFVLQRHRQRLDLQDDPGDLPRQADAGPTARPEAPSGALAHVRRADRHRRRGRRLRRRAGQPRLPAVVPGVQDRRRRLPRVHRLLRRLRRRHLGRLPAQITPANSKESEAVLTAAAAGYRCLLLCDDKASPPFGYAWCSCAPWRRMRAPPDRRRDKVDLCVRTARSRVRSSVSGTSSTLLTSCWAAWPPTPPRCCAASTSRRSRRTSTPATSWSSSTPARSR